MGSTINSTQPEAPEAGLPRTLPYRQTARSVERGCLLALLTTIVVFGVPTYWWLSTYAPVTLVEVRRTSNVTWDTPASGAVCGRWDTTIWPVFGAMSSSMEAIDGTSEDSLWAGTSKGEILRRNNQGWHHVQTLKTDEGKDIRVVKIDVRDENDVWVVGAYASPYTNALFHWDGNRFEQVTVPGLREFGTLSSVAAIGEDDAWFAGSPGRIWHWNGKEITQIQPADEYLKDFDLTGISAVSGNDIWAVGTLTEVAYGAAVIVHWDGSEWTIVKEWGGKEGGTGQPAIGNLWDVIAIAHDDVWAIGGNQAVHWDGREWSPSRMPNYEKYGNVGLGTLAASSSNDVWAVGTSWWGGPRPFAIHWDGAQWSIVPAPMSLNLGGFDTAKSFSGKLLAAGTTYREEEHGPVYSMSAEFEFTPCP